MLGERRQSPAPLETDAGSLPAVVAPVSSHVKEGIQKNGCSEEEGNQEARCEARTFELPSVASCLGNLEGSALTQWTNTVRGTKVPSVKRRGWRDLDSCSRLAHGHPDDRSHDAVEALGVAGHSPYNPRWKT